MTGGMPCHSRQLIVLLHRRGKRHNRYPSGDSATRPGVRQGVRYNSSKHDAMFQRAPAALTRVRKFSLDRWSLAELGVPIYPQDRFHTGLCIALLQTYDLDAVVAVHSSSPSRLTGERNQQRWTGGEEIRQAASRFWFGAWPRYDFTGPRSAERASDSQSER